MTRLAIYMILPLTLASTVSLAQPTEIEEITVLGRQEFLETQFNARRAASNVDAAKLMNEVPGGGFQRGCCQANERSARWSNGK